MKNDGVRSRLIELQSFLQIMINVDPNTQCFDVSSMLYACIVQDAVLSKSIVSGSLCSLSIGSTGRKNLVCLLVKFCPPSINPELMMECKLIAHPT